MNLVTGATGHIGNVLARTLLAQGASVRALVLPGERCDALDGLAVQSVPGNVLDERALARACEGIHTVYHLAGLVSIRPGPDERVRQVNVDGTRAVLAAARAAGVRRLVYVSSIHAIQRIPQGAWIDEEVPFDCQNAISAYDHSKAAASLAVREAAAAGLDAVIACPTGVIGPFDFQFSATGRLIRQVLHNRVVPMVNGAYDFVDVRDVASGLVRAAERGATGETYILSGARVELAALVAMVRQIAGVRPLALTIPAGLARLAAPLFAAAARLRHSEPLITTYSLDTLFSNSAIRSCKACRALDYHPRPLAETLADTIAWWQGREQHAGPA